MDGAAAVQSTQDETHQQHDDSTAWENSLDDDLARLNQRGRDLGTELGRLSGQLADLAKDIKSRHHR
ncbi:hypothetical protein [Catellatospora chokoriensis]|uniref:Uncharacterized protein n=1 Tax=Catellatospora chokoriensis TaxID=310353 RepID=A0A8J3K2X6_9ACTN|nr:hypothetical protein [Catellatospora chokoriensis]GIF93029.1 hypothetical protein Cch02nite_64730 [Catellatospora chokoriensis]